MTWLIPLGVTLAVLVLAWLKTRPRRYSIPGDKGEAVGNAIVFLLAAGGALASWLLWALA